MVFQELMRQHTQLTIVYFETVFQSGAESESGKRRAQQLFQQIEDWLPHTGEGFGPLLREHLELAATAGQQVFTSQDPAATVKRLFENGEEVVDYLHSGGFPASRVRHYWTQHLNCTVAYLTAMKQQGLDSSAYTREKQKCLRIASEFGSFLDSKAKQSINF